MINKKLIVLLILLSFLILPIAGITLQDIKTQTCFNPAYNINCTINTSCQQGEKGDKGDDGYTPVFGVDYFNGSDGYTPVFGVDYFNGADGYTPIFGVDYFNGSDGYTPVKGIDYFDGEKGDKGDKGDTGEIPDSSEFIFKNGSRSMTGNLSMDSHNINLVSEPSLLTDAATKGYVDNHSASTLKFGSQYVTGTRSITKVPISYTTVGIAYWTCPIGVTSIDYLIVGGGGSGGGTIGWVDIGLAGGGAGGVLSGTMAVTPLTTYTIVVGAGGTGVQSAGNNGQNSSFDTLIAVGGGRGDGYNGTWGNGFGGGSGGGAGYNHLVGQPVSGQGYAGGVGGGAGSYPAGGGGGAGSVGGAASTTIAGNGGTGISSTITGSTVWYAGGGGGGKSTAYGAGGSGGSSIGGVGGGNNIYPTAGTVNTGSGGGGASGGNNGYWTGGNGGSGIVIISYATENSQNVNTITHGLGKTPTAAFITLSNTTEMAAVTAMNETTITVAITKPSYFGGTNQTIYWMVV